MSQVMFSGVHHELRRGTDLLNMACSNGAWRGKIDGPDEEGT